MVGYDTCKCIFEFEYDKDLPPEQFSPRVFYVRLCPEHGNLQMNIQEAYEFVTKENQRKNHALLETGLSLGLENDENFFNSLDQYVERWYMSGKNEDRIVHIVTKNLDENQKTQLRGRNDLRFGSRKVIIE